MTAFLWYHRRSRPTGRKLAAALGIPSGREPRAADVIIRWGNSTPLPAALRNSVVINSNLYNAQDKLRAFTIWKDAGVRIPEIRQGGPVENDGSIWLGRRRRGFGGTDIQVFGQYTNLPATSEAALGASSIEFYSKFIPNEREYRIHVCNGEIIRVQRKYLDFPEQRTSEYIKNYANGYRFRQPQRTLNRERTDAAIAACEALRLDFGAVDCVIGSEDNFTYILEVNTAPKLAPLTARRYAEALAGLVNEHGCRITVDYEALEAFREGGSSAN